MKFASSHHRIIAPSLLVLAVAWGRPVQAQGTLTQEEALALAFPAPAQVERRTAYLDDSQVAQARKLAGNGVDVTQRVVTYYSGKRGDAYLGAAYFDSHRVRTLGEVLMIVVAPSGEIQRIEVLKFTEPPEYRAPAGWLDQFEGKELTQELSVKRSIVNMTGATLTSNAVTSAARRVLALHAVIKPFGGAK